MVTGMSGAGKSSVLRMLEDAGYFCADNLPNALIPTFMQLTMSSTEQIEKVALGVDVRSGKKLGLLIQEMKEKGYVFEILFLEASTNVLVKRFKETRRKHPLAGEGRIDHGIEQERRELSNLKEQADYILDTSHMLIRELKQEIDRIFIANETFSNFFVNIVSFGFKYGIPTDADLVFDVRFLPNPFYIDKLKPMTGNDQAVYSYVMNSDAAKEFLNKLKEMLLFLIPNYILEGKNQLVVAIGCTGGKHRSVTLANAIFEELQNSEYACKVEHRDIEKDRMVSTCHFQEK